MVREPPPTCTCSYFTPISCCFSGVIWTVPTSILETSSAAGAAATPPSDLNGARAAAHLHLLVLHANQLLLLRRNLDRADFHFGNVLRRGCRRDAAIGIDRFKFHAAIRRDPGLVGLVRRMHGIDPVEDLAGAFVRGWRAAFHGLVDVPARKRQSDHRQQTNYSNGF